MNKSSNVTTQDVETTIHINTDAYLESLGIYKCYYCCNIASVWGFKVSSLRIQSFGLWGGCGSGLLGFGWLP